MVKVQRRTEGGDALGHADGMVVAMEDGGAEADLDALGPGGDGGLSQKCVAVWGLKKCRSGGPVA